MICRSISMGGEMGVQGRTGSYMAHRRSEMARDVSAFAGTPKRGRTLQHMVPYDTVRLNNIADNDRCVPSETV